MSYLRAAARMQVAVKMTAHRIRRVAISKVRARVIASSLQQVLLQSRATQPLVITRISLRKQRPPRVIKALIKKTGIRKALAKFNSKKKIRAVVENEEMLLPIVLRGETSCTR